MTQDLVFYLVVLPLAIHISSLHHCSRQLIEAIRVFWTVTSSTLSSIFCRATSKTFVQQSENLKGNVNQATGFSESYWDWFGVCVTGMEHIRCLSCEKVLPNMYLNNNGAACHLSE